MSMDAPHLSRLLDEAADRRPEGVAVEDESGRSVAYAGLARMADRLATRLARWGVGRGDRVGLFAPKSIEAVAAIHGILRAGAAYVPVDPTAPAVRGAGILDDAGVKAAVVASSLAKPLRDAWPSAGPLPRRVVIGGECGLGPEDAAWEEILADGAPAPLPPQAVADDLAYILYTSGSTGRPKGVALSHANAFAFLDWCRDHLGTVDGDRFASHAPFHFDLSVFDLYAAVRHASPLVLIGESLAKDPARLAGFIDERRVDVWYSAPSILGLIASESRRVRHADHPASRASIEDGPHGGPCGEHTPKLVLFAGEVFPIEALKRLRNQWPTSTLWNLYGPTETNVCAAHRVPDVIPPDHAQPMPIGRTCAPHRARVVDESNNEVEPGSTGELLIAGPGVMLGYFGRPDLTGAAFLDDPDGTRWYRTGDLVADEGDGIYRFHGRRDRMVKKRGYRIELGEVESALHRHEGVERAAVVARDDGDGLAIAAFVALKPDRKGSIIAMKRHCTLYLPHYMIPDTIAFVPELPATSTGKVDYQGLAALDATGRRAS